MSPPEQRRRVRQRYGHLARQSDGPDSRNAATAADGDRSCCDWGDAQSGCCDDTQVRQSTESVDHDLKNAEARVTAGELDLGCGNPHGIAGLQSGETVLDLGSGAGFDCFQAADAVGSSGRVIGVDMTPAMIDRARDTKTELGAEHVEFRLGEIEHLPVNDSVIDVIISNCVINLSPEKARVFEEAYRVLRPGGRLAIADIVKTAEIPASHAPFSPDSIAACIAGAATIETMENLLRQAGFQSISIKPKDNSTELLRDWNPDHSLERYFVSAVIEAEKPFE